MRAGQFLSIFAIVRAPQETMRVMSGMQACHPEIHCPVGRSEKFVSSIPSPCEKLKSLVKRISIGTLTMRKAIYFSSCCWISLFLFL
jgi:hypothetical protein